MDSRRTSHSSDSDFAPLALVRQRHEAADTRRRADSPAAVDAIINIAEAPKPSETIASETFAVVDAASAGLGTIVVCAGPASTANTAKAFNAAKALNSSRLPSIGHVLQSSGLHTSSSTKKYASTAVATTLPATASDAIDFASSSQQCEWNTSGGSGQPSSQPSGRSSSKTSSKASSKVPVECCCQALNGESLEDSTWTFESAYREPGTSQFARDCNARLEGFAPDDVAPGNASSSTESAPTNAAANKRASRSSKRSRTSHENKASDQATSRPSRPRGVSWASITTAVASIRSSISKRNSKDSGKSFGKASGKSANSQQHTPTSGRKWFPEVTNPLWKPELLCASKAARGLGRRGAICEMTSDVTPPADSLDLYGIRDCDAGENAADECEAGPSRPAADVVSFEDFLDVEEPGALELEPEVKGKGKGKGKGKAVYRQAPLTTTTETSAEQADTPVKRTAWETCCRFGKAIPRVAGAVLNFGLLP